MTDTVPLPAADLEDTPDPETAVLLPRMTPAAAISNILLAAFGVLFAIPMAWMILASLDKRATWKVRLPEFTLEHFRYTLAEYGRQSLINGIVISVVATVFGTLIAVLGAYALSRFHIPWKGPLLLVVLFLSAVPMTVLIIPIFQIFAARGWLSMIPTALFLGVTTLPFEMYIIKNFIDAVPTDLEEAAQIEQAGPLTVLRRVILPLAAPGIASAAIFTFVNAWGAFLIPLVLINDPAEMPGSVAIYGFITAQSVRYGDVAAYSLVYSVPVMLLYVGMSRLLSGGFVLSGAIRG